MVCTANEFILAYKPFRVVLRACPLGMSSPARRRKAMNCLFLSFTLAEPWAWGMVMSSAFLVASCCNAAWAYMV